MRQIDFSVQLVALFGNQYGVGFFQQVEQVPVNDTGIVTDGFYHFLIVGLHPQLHDVESYVLEAFGTEYHIPGRVQQPGNNLRFIATGLFLQDPVGVVQDLLFGVFDIRVLVIVAGIFEADITIYPIALVFL